MKKLALWLLALLLMVCCNSTQEVDVLVIGGTTGGTSAGIQAARMGVHTLIVEETAWLGGMLTAAGVSATDGNHHLSSGIWHEFRELLRKRYGGAEALSTGWVSATLFEPHVGDSIFKAMAQKEEKLEVLYGYWPVSVQKKGDRVTGATFQNDEGKTLHVKARITIDATDLGDGLAMAGATYRLGMDAACETGESIALPEANDLVQDLTWVAILKDYGKAANKAIEKPQDYDAALYRGCCDLLAEGDCATMLNYGRLPNNKYMLNWPRHGNDIYLNVVEMSREQRVAELQKAKNRTLGFVYYIQTELGFPHLGLADDEFATDDWLAYRPYHREGRRLDGIVRFTFNHVADPYNQRDNLYRKTDGKKESGSVADENLYRTGISVGDYPVDHHHTCKSSPPTLTFQPVPSFCVPLGALIPEKTDGLIVCDKAISVTNLINGSTRLQPVVLLTGQAAGVLAALSIIEKKSPREIPVRMVQQKLLEASAYIMPLFDVTPEDPHFNTIQKITATGILKTQGEPYHWANRTWFYPDSNITTHELFEGLKSYHYPVADEPDDKPLTIGKCIDILSSLKGNQMAQNDKDGEVSADLIVEIQNNWERISPYPFRPDAPATKREIAVLLDRILDPFSLPVDHHGFINPVADKIQSLSLRPFSLLGVRHARKILATPPPH